MTTVPMGNPPGYPQQPGPQQPGYPQQPGPQQPGYPQQPGTVAPTGDGGLRIAVPHAAAIRALAVVPGPNNQPVLACAGMTRIGLHDAMSGVTTTWTPTSQAPRALVTLRLPDGRIVLGGDGPVGYEQESLRFWDPLSGAPVGQPIQGHQGRITTLLGLESGQPLVAAGSAQGAISFWDPVKGVALGLPLGGHTGPVHALAGLPSPDGQPRLVSADDSGTLRLWRAPGRRALGRWSDAAAEGTGLNAHTGTVRALTSFPVGSGRMLLASAGDDLTVRLWDAATLQAVLPPLCGHTEPVLALGPVPFPSGATMVASADRAGAIQLWDPASGAPLWNPPAGHGAPVLALASFWLANGAVVLVSAGADGVVRWWDARAGAPIGATGIGDPGWTQSLAWCPRDGAPPLLATASDSGEVRLWDARTGSPDRARPNRHDALVTSALTTSLADGHQVLLTADRDGLGLVRSWNLAAGTPAGPPWRTMTPHNVALAALRAGDGVTVAVASGQTVELFDLATGQDRGRIRGLVATTLAAVPRTEGRDLLAAGPPSGAVQFWDVDAGRSTGPSVPIEGLLATMTVVCLPSGTTLLALGDDAGFIEVRDVATAMLIVRWRAHADQVASLAAVTLGGGRVLLASASRDGAVRLWDPAAGAPVGSPLSGPEHGWAGSLDSTALPDGRALLAFITTRSGVCWYVLESDGTVDRAGRYFAKA